jgi:hypothetical protein
MPLGLKLPVKSRIETAVVCVLGVGIEEPACHTPLLAKHPALLFGINVVVIQPDSVDL